MHKHIFLIFLLACFKVYSQQYNIQLYNTDNGLPQNSVKDIIKDKYGFLWITTENGIVRYDGANFLVYKNFPLNSQRFTYFYGSPDKDSIFSTGGYGRIILLHEKKPTVYENNKKNQNFISKDNIEYFLYSSNYSYGVVPVNYYMKLKKGMYYLKENFLLYKSYHTKTEEKLKINPFHENIPRIFAINESVFFLDIRNQKVKQIEEDNIINSYHIPLLTDRKSKIFWNQINNQVFILNENTLYTCRYETGQLKITPLMQMSNNIKKDNLISIYYDEFYKKLYLGSSTDGLQIISFSEFTAIKSPKSHSIFYSLLPFSSSSVITYWGEVYDRNGFITDKKFKDTSPFFMDYDQNRNIIVRNEGHAMIYKKESSYKNFISLPIKDFFINGFFYDENRYYAIIVKPGKNGTNQFYGMLAVYKDTSFNSLEKKIIFNDEPTRFLRINRDNMLVGTIKGLYKVSLITNKAHLIGTDEISIRNIIKSKNGNFWITTLGKGFYLLKNDRLIKMPRDSNDNISSAHTILEDSNGFFWIPTNNGLYKVLESQLLKYAQDQSFKVNYYRFSKDSGFNTNEFNGGSNVCSAKLENGEFVLPSLDGLVFFDPLKIKSYYPENLYVERCLVDNQELYFKNNLYLDQESDRIEIFIDAPYFANPDNMVIQAKLSGNPQKKWQLIGKERKFSISNLGYGNHILTVRILVSDTGKFIYKKVNIIIPPYFYQTFWFKIIIFLILSFLLYFLVKWRLSFLKKKNYELERVINLRTKKLSDTVEKLETTKIRLHKEIEQQKKLIGTITHDITTPIKFIAHTAKEILEKEEFDQKLTEKILHSIYKSSDQLYNFTITLKEYADIYSHREDKTEFYSLYQLIEEKRILFSTIAENDNTAIINNVNPFLQTQISKNILAVILHNLLDNSVKFTKNGTITINNTLENENIILLISDTGIGMDEKKIEYYTKLQDNIESEKLLLQKYGMGLHLVLQLLQMINSKIVFEKNKLQGTSFKLILTNKKND
ncbi:histidine kinase [Chryseobacterium glaciei]|uniref:Histidine kinase n=1 Tax=Chryseobacterium glaciei TaxID=1685010 RepID=A0A172XRT1_9FLAO|nr:HAMP domain-containing sensor histidine kinase [Chryseobacterium glaciei]ANF49636.1 histidine kinase [Chryseobacterium glaciei]